MSQPERIIDGHAACPLQQRRHRTPARRPHRGAALLTALLIVVLITTLAAAMMWRQARSIQIEAAERGRAQSDWVLQGALDWARLILREDSRANVKTPSDHLGEVWAVPLAEARLSSFLSTDSNHSADSGPDAYLSGRIEDAQSRYNLRNLVKTDPAEAAKELAIAARLFQSAGLNTSIAPQLQKSLKQAINGAASGAQGDVPLTPMRLDQLRWLGLSPEQIERLRPLVVILPAATPVNLNTAPREVITALDERIDLSTADRLIRARDSKPFSKLEDVAAYLPQSFVLSAEQTAITTTYFFVEGRLRMDDRVLTLRSLVNRESPTSLVLKVLDRERIQQQTSANYTNYR
ncbi:type II secretion system minor pseudopilin GspK [Roseateles amylovorans]|uniref:Type II secretion system protein K n=1 Tax=Roseateles amylovorans TaxID=2978473 RepID=A0ABY6B274_9BURK|nr:type II secretion system minor pseudopilin GspK [Roseateles amylovorans]UXH79318.1 type II secretion system minor pseudopilin GspK [Roseateles amylovorans]